VIFFVTHQLSWIVILSEAKNLTLFVQPLIPMAVKMLSVLSTYIGRIAPSPTGYLHLGHARTFWTAHQRAQIANGTLLFRNDDLDPHRSKPEFIAAMIEDLRWLGIEWSEPIVNQSERMPLYRAKVASDMQKPDGLIGLLPSQLPWAIAHLELRA